MNKSTVLSLTACLSSILWLAGCSEKNASTPPCNDGDPGCSAGAGNSSTGGSGQSTTKAGSGGSSSMGGVTSAGGTTTNTTTSAATGGSSTAAGGTTAKASTGGTTNSVGGKTSTGGTTSAATGGTKAATGGTTSAATGGTKAATGGTTSAATGGTKAATGGTSAAAAGGTLSTGGSVAATGGSAAPTTDANGKAIAKPGDKTSTANDYLYLGNSRLINNNWGSVALGSGCSAPMSVEIKSDGSMGWTFNRGNCNDDGSHPDYPELEFGVAPFGRTSSLRTTPPFSTTTLLPLQVSKIQDASVSIGNFSIQLNSNKNWNLNIEFWLSKLDPLTNDDAQAYTEIMALWGLSEGAQKWQCNASGNVSSGGKSYNLCHQSDNWASGWRFFQFQASNGSQQSFSGTVDVKAFLDWFYNSSYGSGVSKDYYLTRIEIGSEIDDSTSGSCTLKDVSFTINGVTETPLK